MNATLKPALFLLALGAMLAPLAVARSQNAVALAGRVSSPAEGHMEGVLISAKGLGSTASITVVSGANGDYAFPAKRLNPGTYRLSIRAVGYDLRHPFTVEVQDGQTTRADIVLVETNELAAQLTSAEWLESIPGTEAQKNWVYHCAACHSLTPVVESKYDARSWLATLVRMRAYSGQSVLSAPVKLPFALSVEPDPELAKYLSTINLSSKAKWDYALKKHPRPRGRATRVIVTEYDLPGTQPLPHDAILDRDGMVWYNDFHEDLIGRLDPRTGQTKEWRLSRLKSGVPTGLLSIKFDPQGYLWIPRFRQGGITRFDPRTEKFQTWPVPKQHDNDRTDSSHVAPGAPDGTVWFSDSENRLMYRLHPETGQIETFQTFPHYHPSQTTDVYGRGEKPTGHRTYGIAVDSLGNGYFADILGGNIGKVDARAGQVTLFKTPTLNSGPRRMYMDSADRLWFGENYGNNVGMLDTRSGRITEWTPPTPWSGPYPAMSDKHGEVWTGGMSTDYVYRLDPATGQFTEYLLPTLEANIRRIYVDDSTTPVTVWVAEVHHGKIARVEPLD